MSTEKASEASWRPSIHVLRPLPSPPQASKSTGGGLPAPRAPSMLCDLWATDGMLQIQAVGLLA